MADDERPTADDGFDDWLDEEPGPDTDPYAALAEDDAEAEIADWMAFTDGSGAPPAEPQEGPAPTGEGDEPEDATEELVALGNVDTGDVSGAFDPDELTHMPVIRPPDAEDETTEIPALMADESDHEPELQPATSVEVDEFDGGGRADTDEIPIIAGADVEPVEPAEPDEGGTAAPSPGGIVSEPGAIESTSDDVPEEEPVDVHVADDTGELPIDDTGELDVVEDEPVEFAAIALDDSPGGQRPVFDLETADVEATPDDPFELDRGDYLSTATREHDSLAEAIAAAETHETEKVALAAPIPGLESTVVGFEDVVEAEGHTRARARASGDLLARVITAAVLIIALGASLVWQPALVGLATVVFVVGAGEFYTALRRSGRQPIALFGFLGILGASLGGFIWGAVAIPVSFLLVASLLLLYYAVVPGRVDPMANLALTVSVMIWAGLGTYAMMIIDSPDYRPLVIGVVLTVALMDIAQYFIGRALGRHALAPWVSPKKTVEGLVGGVIVAFALGALLHFVPPFELTSGLAIGAAVAVLSPVGDLAMSAAKRSLDIKDMGSILPGHGGFMDRIDGLLFVIPAAWAIFLWTGLI